MKLLTILLFSVLAFGQFQNPLIVYPAPSGTSGAQIRLREAGNNGVNFFGFRAPASMASDLLYDLPSTDGTAGQVLSTNGGQVLSWASVAGNTIPVCASTNGTDAYTCTVSGFTSYSANYCIILSVDTANTLTATVDISGVGVKSILRYGGSALSTNDILVASPVMICYDGTQFTLPPSASPGSGAFLDGGNTFGAAATLGTNDNYNLIFEQNNVPLVELGSSGFNIAPSGIANFFTRVTKLDIGDITGAGGEYDFQASASFLSNSSLKLRDNGGGRVFQVDRAVSGTRVNNFGVFSSLIPRKRDTGDGDDVSDSDFPNLGAASYPWAKVYISELYADGINQSMYPAPTNTIQLGGVSNLFSGIYTADLILNTTADIVAGDCWMATDTVGNGAWTTCSGADVITTDYDWTRTPGGSLSATTPATVTLTTCPDGVAPYSTHHNVYISGGTGTAETVLITAVSGSGATCDISFTPVNSHTGAWTVSSASDGVHEAARMVTGAKRLFIPLGAQTMNEPAPGEETTVYIQSGITIAGGGNDPGTGSYLSVTGDQWAIIFDTVYPVKASNFAVSGTGVMSAGGGIKLTAPGAGHNCFSIFEHLQISSVPVSMHLEKGCATIVKENWFSSYGTYGLLMENTSYPDAGDQYVSGNQFFYFGTGGIGTTAIRWLSAGGARIQGNKFNTQGGGIDLESNTNTIIASVTGNSFDNQTEFSVKVRAPSPDSFAFINISSNIFTGAGAAGYEAIDIGDTTDDIDNVVISGNNMQAAGTAIRIGSADKVIIGGNIIGLFTTGIQTTSAATEVNLGQNSMYSVTTNYDIASDSTIKPVSPLFVAGYARQWASATNVKSIAEFSESSVGATANNAVMFLNGSTGANSQRGIWWGYSTGDMNFARFGTAKTAAPTTDFKLETDGDAVFSYKVGIGASPTVGIDLDVRGTIRSTDGTTDMRFQTSAGAGYIGTTSNHPVLIMQNATERLRVGVSLLLPGTADYYSIGDPTKRFLGTYSKIVDTVASGGTGDYMQTRKLQLYDNTGSTTGASFWDLNVVMSGVGAGQNSYFYLRDNGGTNVFKSERISSGVAVDRTLWYTDLMPDTTGGQNLGSASLHWGTIWVDELASDLFPRSTDTYVLGNGTKRWSSIRTLDFRADGFVTFSSGAVNGYVWTSDASGVGSWQASSGSLPVADTTAIVKGSVTAGKLMRFEVDGFSSSSITHVLTVPDYDFTIAGANIAQTFSGANTFSVGQTFSSGLVTGSSITNNSANAYDLGSSSSPFNIVYGRNFTATDGTYSRIILNNPGAGSNVGNAFSFRDASGNLIGYLSYGGTFFATTVSGTNISASGTITAPSGSSGWSGTRTIRDSAGTGTCTLIFSGGILTGGTC